MTPRPLNTTTPDADNSSPLDSTDRTILQLLQQNARIPHREIAGKTGKSISRIFDRIRRLKKEGYIRQIVALLDGQMIGRGLTVYASVRLTAHARRLLLDFEQQVTALEEVMEAYHLSGGCDFLLRIEVRDMEAYHHFLVHRLYRIGSIDSVKSSFVVREPAAGSAHP